MEIPVFFGDWLKQRRKALDLTQDELAKRAGCSVFALRKIESGERRPSKQLATLLASALEIPAKDQPTFMRVARGEIHSDRLQVPNPDLHPPSISDLLTSPETAESAAPNKSPKPAASHLPTPLSPLLGRDPEISAMDRIFNSPQCRLLTLTGMGGIGKTRLAIEFASRQSASFPNGVFFVALASINSAESIVPTLAEALGFSFFGPADLKEQLINYMSDTLRQPALLVLDNLEHLTAQSSAAVDFVADLLQRVPSLKILATSRERLNLQGEWMFELHGLPVPTEEFAHKVDEYSAAVLFIQRAQHIRSDFDLDEAGKLELAHICRLLEGIPLAIELAAAWVGLLTCAEIAREIETNIDFLSTSMRDIPERHRSLRATFDHSWKLLSDVERDVLSRLSVFRGGFDRQAAEQVAGATLPLLASLISKSLVRRADTGRNDLHQAIRQYAASHLEQDPALQTETFDAHCEYYLKLASGNEAKLKSAAQQSAMNEMTLEMDNLRVAWAWALQRKKFGLLEISVRSVGWMFEAAGMLREGIEQLEPLAKILKADIKNGQWNKVLAVTLTQQALLNFRKGQFDGAQRLYTQSIDILRPIGDQRLLADALIFLGTILHLNGEYDRSRALLEEGLACAQAVADPWFTAYGIYNLGYFDSLMGEHEKGYQQMVAALDMWRSLGDPIYIALGSNFLVTTQIKLGRCEEAQQSMRENISLCERTRNRWGMGTAYRYLGLAMMADEKYAEARTYLQKSLEIFGDYFEGWDIALSLAYLADAVALSGDRSEAKAIYLDALRHAHRIRSVPLVLMTLTGLAQLESRQSPGRSAHWLALVLSHPAAPQDLKDRAAQIQQDLKAHQIEDQKKGSEKLVMDQDLDDAVNALIAP